MARHVRKVIVMGVGYEFGEGELGFRGAEPVADAHEIPTLGNSEDLSPLTYALLFGGCLLEGIDHTEHRGQRFSLRTFELTVDGVAESFCFPRNSQDDPTGHAILHFAETRKPGCHTPPCPHVGRP
ncbi:hypothetical protein [Streptomyces sp. NPDC048243]|uniref:hypothetical protein n=1 Tax=Streptomyces sp. NPDC048243 TaxID=3365522 RepID=UPI00371FE8D7